MFYIERMEAVIAPNIFGKIASSIGNAVHDFVRGLADGWKNNLI